MGLCIASARLLVGAKNAGVDFSDCLQIGRQSMLVKPKRLAPIFASGGINGDVKAIGSSAYAEPFFMALGAKRVFSLDASSYEGSTFIHDLNKPLPDEKLINRFSAVFDGGSLEHVFNFPQALKTCMEMVGLHGHFIQATVANNLMGHGFWQISPELIFRVFTPENGYSLRAVLLHEVKPRGAWFMVDDPIKHRSRVELCNHRQTFLMTIAQRTALVPVLAGFPQQSDYLMTWAGGESRKRPRKLVRNAKRVLRAVRSIMALPVGFDEPYFTRISRADVVAGHYMR